MIERRIVKIVPIKNKNVTAAASAGFGLQLGVEFVLWFDLYKIGSH